MNISVLSSFFNKPGLELSPLVNQIGKTTPVFTLQLTFLRATVSEYS